MPVFSLISYNTKKSIISILYSTSNYKKNTQILITFFNNLQHFGSICFYGESILVCLRCECSNLHLEMEKILDLSGIRNCMGLIFICWVSLGFICLFLMRSKLLVFLVLFFGGFVSSVWLKQYFDVNESVFIM